MVIEDDDLVGEDAGAAGDSSAISTGLADHGRGLAGDRGLVDRRDAFDDLAVGREQDSRPDNDEVAGDAKPLGTSTIEPSSTRFGQRLCRVCLAERGRLCFAAAFRHGLGEVREEHGEPEPGR